MDDHAVGQSELTITAVDDEQAATAVVASSAASQCKAGVSAGYFAAFTGLGLRHRRAGPSAARHRLADGRERRRGSSIFVIRAVGYRAAPLRAGCCSTDCPPRQRSSGRQSWLRPRAPPSCRWWRAWRCFASCSLTRRCDGVSGHVRQHAAHRAARQGQRALHAGATLLFRCGALPVLIGVRWATRELRGSLSLYAAFLGRSAAPLFRSSGAAHGASRGDQKEEEAMVARRVVDGAGGWRRCVSRSVRSSAASWCRYRLSSGSMLG